MQAQVQGLTSFLPQVPEDESVYTESSTSEFVRPYVATGEEMARLSRSFARDFAEVEESVRIVYMHCNLPEHFLVLTNKYADKRNIGLTS